MKANYNKEFQKIYKVIRTKRTFYQILCLYIVIAGSSDIEINANHERQFKNTTFLKALKKTTTVFYNFIMCTCKRIKESIALS